MTAPRTPIVAANWKMNYGIAEAGPFVERLLPGLSAISSVERVICPPFIALSTVFSVLKDSPVKLGAQNMYFETQGAYTGEISPLMLQGLCRYVILGHSERRALFNESDELVNKKILAALRHNLLPILCVGEHLDHYEATQTEYVVGAQLRGSLADLTAAQLGQVVIAYEPIWAIGTGKASTGANANNVCAFIRQTLAELSTSEIAAQARIQYGGSVTAANIAEFAAQPDIDGALVGGASLKPEFIDIVQAFAK